MQHRKLTAVVTQINVPSPRTTAISTIKFSAIQIVLPDGVASTATAAAAAAAAKPSLAVNPFGGRGSHVDEAATAL